MLGLVAALNAWWLVRDMRPVPELRTVGDWVRLKRYDDAEAALREHLRRSPHNGAAMIMLASVKAERGDNLGAARQLHAVPFWWPNKLDLSFLEGQLFLESGRGRDAEAAWNQCLHDDPLHPPPPQSQVVRQAALELMKLYGRERRLGEAHALAGRVIGRLDRDAREDVLRLLVSFEVGPSAPAADGAGPSPKNDAARCVPCVPRFTITSNRPQARTAAGTAANRRSPASPPRARISAGPAKPKPGRNLPHPLECCPYSGKRSGHWGGTGRRSCERSGGRSPGRRSSACSTVASGGMPTSSWACSQSWHGGTCPRRRGHATRERSDPESKFKVGHYPGDEVLCLPDRCGYNTVPAPILDTLGEYLDPQSNANFVFLPTSPPG